MRMIPLLITTCGLMMVQAAYADDFATAPGPESGIYPNRTPDPRDILLPKDLSVFKQPQSLVDDLAKIQKGSLKARIKALADKSRRDQIFVQGGAFWMGDFGRLQNDEELPYDGNRNSSPLHEVALDSYSISKYKVTLAEFDVYAEANNVPSVQTEKRYVEQRNSSQEEAMPWRSMLDRPAGTTWEQAAAYCQWVGKITGQPFALPTEAQWEYAARSRGRWIVFPTDNGKLDWNRNSPNDALITVINSGPVPMKKVIDYLNYIYNLDGGYFEGTNSDPYRIALFPPNPLGLYDLGRRNSLDWVQDWYADDWYRHSNKTHNPTGPETGTEKVLRGDSNISDNVGMTIKRQFKKPEQQFDPRGEPRSNESSGFRCAVNSPTAIEQK